MPKKPAKTETKPKRKSVKKLWDDTMYVQCYCLARTGMSDDNIARNLGIRLDDFLEWKLSKPALQDALRRARTQETCFRDYVYGRLSPAIKEAWDRICLFDRAEDDDYDLDPVDWLGALGEKARQELFLFALVHCNFNPSRACKKVNLENTVYRTWMRSPEFLKIMQEMHWHKQNFFEEALVGKIKEGDTHAIIFANRTMNRERGYGDKVEVNHTGSVQHQHQVLLTQTDIEGMGLSLACRKELLEGMRRMSSQKEAPKQIEHRSLPSPTRPYDQPHPGGKI